jgi:hypothetical protein
MSIKDFPLIISMEIVEGHCFAKMFTERFVAKDIIEKTSKQW